MKKLTLSLISFLCFALPFVLCFLPFELIEDKTLRLVWLLLVAPTYVLMNIVVAGLISRFGLSGLKEGKFNRDVSDSSYFKRRIHATPWTYLFYFKPVYYLMLSNSFLRHIGLRLFGYKGNTNFTVYPDTWLRDVPLLDIGKDAYLSNKSSIATNICLMDGRILVEGIKIGDSSCVGHSTLIGPGTKLGSEVELGADITSGIRVKYGDRVKVYEKCGIQHGVLIEEDAVIEGGAVLGLRTKIGKGVRIREGSHIHAGIRIKTQEEADALYSEETGALTRKKNLVAQQLKEAFGESASARPLVKSVDKKVTTGDA